MLGVLLIAVHSIYLGQGSMLHQVKGTAQISIEFQSDAPGIVNYAAGIALSAFITRLAIVAFYLTVTFLDYPSAHKKSISSLDTSLADSTDFQARVETIMKESRSVRPKCPQYNLRHLTRATPT